jgi:hypothetical protein
MARLTRVEQRREDDCSVAVVATVMGAPFVYERVLADNPNYAKVSDPPGTVIAISLEC